MFGINAKEIFQQKISDVIVILFAIHLLAITFTYIIKWIRPYLKNCAAECKQKPKYSPEYSLLLGSWFKNQSSKTAICNECEGETTDCEYANIFGNLKPFVDIADNPSKAVLDTSNLMKINMMSDSEFENALNLGNFLSKRNKRKCSSEAQTNITINPGTKVDFSCPELILCNLIPEKIIKTTDSSDSFLSASSRKSSADLKKELEQIINELVESNDDGPNEKIDEDITIQQLQKYLKTSLAKTDVAGSFGLNEKQVSQENKLLEMAITEFEKELKPIKDQIQILKECISGFDLASNTRNSIGLSSDFTSSFSGSGMFSESCSGTLSTCCSTDLHSYFSSYHIVSATSFGSSESDTRYKNMKKLDKIASLNPLKHKQKNNRSSKHSTITNKESLKTQVISNSTERCKSNKRSPIAEMYVKLSQCNSQSSCMVKSKKERLMSSENTVTYRIDLNVNLAGSKPVSNCQKSKLLKEREIQPLTSDPDEILGKPSNTHVSLRPAIK